MNKVSVIGLIVAFTLAGFVSGFYTKQVVFESGKEKLTEWSLMPVGTSFLQMKSALNLISAIDSDEYPKSLPAIRKAYLETVIDELHYLESRVQEIKDSKYKNEVLVLIARGKKVVESTKS